MNNLVENVIDGAQSQMRKSGLVGRNGKPNARVNESFKNYSLTGSKQSLLIKDGNSGASTINIVEPEAMLKR